jgi:hypothetical protein
MWRAWIIVCLSVVLCLGVAAAAPADDKEEKHQIQGGIEGKVKAVDVENKKLTIITDQGRERTYTITDETMMAGPRGGKVRKHLNDPRFRAGFPVTIVAEGSTATEVHFGFTPGGSQEKAEAMRGAARETRPPSTPTQTPTSSRVVPSANSKETTKPDEEEDDTEIPGKIKSYDPARRILVLSLLNGANRSFVLAKDVPVMVGRTASKKGLEDSALKEGATVTVFTEDGGHKVKEIKIAQHSWFRSR